MRIRYTKHITRIKKIFKSVLDEVWRDQWCSLTSNKLREIKTTIIPFNNSSQKQRNHEVALCRLRNGHTRLTHGFLMSNQPPPECSTCHTRVTVKHILIECPEYSHSRRKHLGSSPEMQDILGEDDSNVRKIFRFLIDIDLLRYI